MVIQSIRGMNDILPEKTPLWQYLEAALRQAIPAYGYQEIRLPYLESTALFKRAIGEVTDIVEKEMYTFMDRNGDSLSLRPEGTAGCVRACIQHHLLYNQTQRLWYTGPMFRYERPQKGRYRQFYQLGVEAYGFSGIDIELELILMGARLWEILDIHAHITLDINTLGTLTERQHYREKLVTYFQEHKSVLDEDSLRRLKSNPLRILDSKNPALQALIEAAPKLIDFLETTSRERFEQLCQCLDHAGITYRVNPRLVRGLDYYSHTVFEWVTHDLGSQGTVCAGGRYDSLITQLGGDTCPAVGFAIGIERLVLLLENLPHIAEKLPPVADIVVLLLGNAANTRGRIWLETLRRECPHYNIIAHCGDSSMKNQFKKADKSDARIALILGEDEMNNHTIGVKFLRENHAQETVEQSQIVSYLNVNDKSFNYGVR